MSQFPPIDPGHFEAGKSAYGRGASIQALWIELAQLEAGERRREEEAYKQAHAAGKDGALAEQPLLTMSYLLGYLDGLASSIRRTESALMMGQVPGRRG